VQAQKEVEAQQLQAEARRLAEERDPLLLKAPVDDTVFGLEGLFEALAQEIEKARKKR
jgi:hypothetical protein